MLNCLIKRNHNLAVVFLDETTSEDEVLLAELEKIDGETKKYDIDFVKVEKSLYNSLLTPFQCDTNPMMSWFLCELFPPARLRTTTRPPTQPPPPEIHLANAAAAERADAESHLAGHARTQQIARREDESSVALGKREGESV